MRTMHISRAPSKGLTIAREPVRVSFVLAAVLAMGCVLPAGARVSLVPWNHPWKYYHPMGSLPASPGNFTTTWFAEEITFLSTYTGPPFGADPAVTGNPATTSSYDSGSGPGPIGYGVIDYMSSVGAEFTAFGRSLTSPASGNRRAAYFRTTFTVPSDGANQLTLRYLMDDGGFIYLDGTLVCTVNMPAGAADNYTQNASNSTSTESAPLRSVNLNTPGAQSNANVLIPIPTISAGSHTLAVSVRSDLTTSSDLCMAVELTAEPFSNTPIIASANNVVRFDDGNINSADDTLSFTIFATGPADSTGWHSTNPTASGSYGTPVNLTGASITNPAVPFPLTLEDNIYSGKSISVAIPLPPVVGRNLISGGNLFLESPSASDGITYDESTPLVRVNNASLTGAQTQLVDLSTVNGAVRLQFDLVASETSATANFESGDTVLAQLILNPGSSQTTLNLLDVYDRNHDGMLNGYTGTSPEPYDSFPQRDEYNLLNQLAAVQLSSTLPIQVTIPDNVTSARLVFSLVNNAAAKDFTLRNLNVASVNPDTDNDGLDDTWEITWFGNLTAVAGSGDADSDGATNTQEALASTRPNDASSVFKITSISALGNALDLIIQTVPGQRYRLETSTTLSPTSWIPNGIDFTATAATTTRTITLPAATQRVFARAAVIPP